tara:strand:+ start:355 stop:477 length:123 start_codon:yes stop_codon:yes gene_type:complete
MSCNGDEYSCEEFGEFPYPDGAKKKKSKEVLEIEKNEESE